MNFAYCFVSHSPVRAEARDTSEMVSQLLFGEPVRILEYSNPWVKIETVLDGYEGYADKKHFRNLSEKEWKRWMDGQTLLSSHLATLETPWGMQYIVRGSFVPFKHDGSFAIGKDLFTFNNKPDEIAWKSIEEAALCYVNAPYLWGGKSPFGIDCSGLTQTVLRFFDINIPRDASQQIEFGRKIDFSEVESGDLGFFHNSAGKIIHVGFCGNDRSFIHASGRVRIDTLNEQGIINIETGELTHHLHSLRRM